MTIIVNWNGLIFGITLITTIVFTGEIGCYHHLLSVICLSFISGIFLMKFRSYRGNISCLILENVGGITLSWISVSQIFQLLQPDYLSKRNLASLDMTFLVEMAQKASGTGNYGTATSILAFSPTCLYCFTFSS